MKQWLDRSTGRVTMYRTVLLSLIGIAVIAFVLSLLIGFVVPILLELRSGVIVEKWQVQHLQLPVLAELRLPANPDK